MKLWPGWLVVLAGACGGSHPASSTPTTSNRITSEPITSDPGLPSTALEPNGTVVRVIDGDTIEVRFGDVEERVRLIGIDTPETKKPDTPIECFGPEASERTHALLGDGTAIRVVRDVEARDDYGRLLGYVYRSSDGLFINLTLVEDGYARPLTIEPNDHFAADFVAAARAAEAADFGLWGSCSG